MTKLYHWWATDGDTAAIATYVHGFEQADSRPRAPSTEAMLRTNIAGGRAYLALAVATPPMRSDNCSRRRTPFTSVRSRIGSRWPSCLIATGRYREASQRLDRRWPGTTSCSNGFDDAMWTLERARMHERVGRRSEALDDYRFIIEAWRHADPELQRYVREAREALTRLR